jgi:hypothetical protein
MRCRPRRVERHVGTHHICKRINRKVTGTIAIHDVLACPIERHQLCVASVVVVRGNYLTRQISTSVCDKRSDSQKILPVSSVEARQVRGAGRQAGCRLHTERVGPRELRQIACSGSSSGPRPGSCASARSSSRACPSPSTGPGLGHGPRQDY